MTIKQISRKNIVSIIPARGGSKGIPGKNIKLLAGKPLIAWTVEASEASESVGATFVSTDNSEVARISESLGAQVLQRPDEISGDHASSESALLHFIRFYEKSREYLPDYVVFLQCTSPIRNPGDIDQAIDRIIRSKADSLLSVVPNHRFIWEKGRKAISSINYDYKNRQRRQDLNPQYMENGSIYIFKPWVLEKFNNRLGGKVDLYEMDPETAFEIDTMLDFDLCDFIMNQKNKRCHDCR